MVQEQSATKASRRGPRRVMDGDKSMRAGRGPQWNDAIAQFTMILRTEVDEMETVLKGAGESGTPVDGFVA